MTDSQEDSVQTQVKQLNDLYTQITVLQQGIPGNRPGHNKHQVEEQAIRDKAYEVLMTANRIPYQGTAYQSEVNSIIVGCQAMMDDPYKKLAGWGNTRP
jgi:pyruvate/oxaloacetate carboxyltransferase